jgi:hypothetical protein
MIAMLTFAISLLFTAGAAFALLVLVAMVFGNHRAIRDALAGRGAYAALMPRDATPPLLTARVHVGAMRRGRRVAAGRSAPVSPLRAAA